MAVAGRRWLRKRAELLAETMGAAAGTAVAMSLHIGGRVVVAPDRVQWRVARRWLSERPRRFRGRRGIGDADSLQMIGSALPDLGGVDLGQEMVAIAAIVAVVLVVIPILLFGLELVIVGVLLGAGVIARTLLGQPWVIEAYRPIRSTRGDACSGTCGDGEARNG